MINLKELKRLAECATHGEWQSCNGYQGFGLIEGIAKQGKVDVIVCDGTYDSQFSGAQKKQDADYIASANPSVILQLIKEHEEMREALEWYRENMHTPFTNSDEANMYLSGELARQTLEGVSK